MMVAAQKNNGTLIIHLFQPGQRLDLRKRALSKKSGKKNFEIK
jgi:hypothetical protein